MTKDEILAAAIRVTAEMYGIDAATITPQTRFIEDLNGDSLDNVEMVMALEDEFEVEISDEDAKELLTVADVAALVERKRA